MTPVEIVAQLCAHFAVATPCDERERESIEQFLAIAPTLDAPFDEHANDTHITGSAIVVGKRGVVLHLHKRLNIWLQPGGHIEQGETRLLFLPHNKRQRNRHVMPLLQKGCICV